MNLKLNCITQLNESKDYPQVCGKNRDESLTSVVVKVGAKLLIYCVMESTEVEMGEEQCFSQSGKKLHRSD